MNKNGILVSFFVLFSLSCSLFAQDKNFTKHTVLKGETIKQIATKYKVTPFDIYKLNPDSRGGIVENDILIIPVQKVEQVTPPAETVLSKPKNTYSNVKTHISDLKGWQSEYSKIYRVNSIPQSFLIGPDGKIIAKNIRGEELNKTLGNLFTN